MPVILQSSTKESHDACGREEMSADFGDGTKILLGLGTENLHEALAQLPGVTGTECSGVQRPKV